MAPGPIVVTGADGFVGSALVAHFVATGRPFVAAVRRHPAGAAAKPHHRAVGDLATASEAALDELVAGAAAIVHLAGRAHVLAETAPDPAALYQAANVVATERLAAAAVRAGVRRFVLASTIKVHGEATMPGRPFRADDPFAPHDAYARSKVEAERALAAIAAGTSLEAIVLRLPLVYGPRVKGNFLTLLDAVAREALAAVRRRREPARFPLRRQPRACDRGAGRCAGPRRRARGSWPTAKRSPRPSSCGASRRRSASRRACRRCRRRC